jgi:hypothetical protein
VGTSCFSGPDAEPGAARIGPSSRRLRRELAQIPYADSFTHQPRNNSTNCGIWGRGSRDRTRVVPQVSTPYCVAVRKCEISGRVRLPRWKAPAAFRVGTTVPRSRRRRRSSPLAPNRKPRHSAVPLRTACFIALIEKIPFCLQRQIWIRQKNRHRLCAVSRWGF